MEPLKEINGFDRYMARHGVWLVLIMIFVAIALVLGIGAADEVNRHGFPSWFPAGLAK